jgi:hypothetical protein
VKTFFAEVLKLEGAATVLAAITAGRVIGQVSRGFAEDDEVIAQATLYKTIAAKYPQGTITIAAMFKRMLGNAQTNSAGLEGLDLTDAEKEEWAGQMGVSEHEQLRTSVRGLVDLLNSVEPTPDAWADLTPLAQYSLAVRTERNLWNAIARYESWTSEEGAKLRTQASEAYPKLEKLVSELTAGYSDELAQARSNGINIANREVHKAA